MGLVFNILLLMVVKMIPTPQPTRPATCGRKRRPRRGNDVFIPFEDRCRGKNQPEPEPKTDYYPHDFDDFGEF